MNENVTKLVHVRPGRKLWDVKVIGPSVRSGWLPSAIQVQGRAKVPPQLLVAVAFEWPGFALVHGGTTHPSEFLDDIRYSALEARQELISQGVEEEEAYWEVSVLCATCGGRGKYECPECGGDGKADEDGTECEVCEGDEDVTCVDCDGEAFWYVDYEPGLEHWPGPTAEWAAQQEAQRGK